MTDNIDHPQGGTADNPQGGTGSAQGAGAIDPTLLKKIEELERDNKKYRDERKAQDAAAKLAAEKHLADQQKWEELANSRGAELEKLKPVSEQYDVITAAFNASLDNRLKQIPDDIRARTIDPIRASLSPVEFSNWLDANLDMFKSRKAPPMDAGAGGSGGGSAAADKALTPTRTDIAMAANMRVPIAEYMKQKAAMERERSQPRTDLDVELEGR